MLLVPKQNSSNAYEEHDLLRTILAISSRKRFARYHSELDQVRSLHSMPGHRNRPAGRKLPRCKDDT
jgi:hypothetical protein